ncbi:MULTISPECIES: nucleotidyltransferase domain-containing protein [unclassified Candidatus Tisiphia]|jgi:predicted nucleotidyltransferase|uniref:Polymerase beta nucleotidyltransferase domain-containing protein n=1 Tax=Candidatus Tisiphia endosymbiont of Sergentomyia squamirostris TaxID=3113639 RepID=A0AAT9G901_9RICK|nr:nucleotidyltransferase domain-containing protein [Rickettsiaceae bacterium]MDD9337657.1 nucleotidyltransferase domain-containing protein [Rickettsiaceae bacterium]MDR0774685.1 nucleotidyltransferase domain-containing protein [Rickettsia sp.]UCM92165.1 MAG: nucleotidyltransferase domain-containing protein [Rickettsia endosymbiont of Cimex lectularius]
MKVQDYKFYNDLISQIVVEEVWLFGSRARNDNQDRADIDLAIVCHNATTKDWLKLQEIVDNADTLLKIDCIRLDELEDSSDLKLSIIREGVKLYERS